MSRAKRWTKRGWRLVVGDTSAFRAHLTLIQRIMRLHRCRLANVTILFVFMASTMYVATAAVWNTGRVASAKIHAQTAADSAAYSAALWKSRAMNQVTATNMIMLRNLTAQTSAQASAAVMIGVPIMWVIHLVRTVIPRFNSLNFAPPWTLPVALAYLFYELARIAAEAVAYVRFLDAALGGGGIIRGFSGRFLRQTGDLAAYQRNLVAALPTVIEAQRASIGDYYGVDITLVEPGQNRVNRVHAPVKRGTFVDNFAPALWLLAARFFIDDNGWYKASGNDVQQSRWEKEEEKKDPNDKKDTDVDDSDDKGLLEQMNDIGKAKIFWMVTSAVSLAAFAGIYHDDFHIPAHQRFWETHPGSLDDKQYYSVIAIAQYPDIRDRFLAPGFFKYAINDTGHVTAAAQAETFNWYSETENSILMSTVRFNVTVLPYRVWSTAGWQWQPRLTEIDQLDHTRRSNPAINNMFDAMGIGSSHANDYDEIFSH